MTFLNVNEFQKTFYFDFCCIWRWSGVPGWLLPILNMPLDLSGINVSKWRFSYILLYLNENWSAQKFWKKYNKYFHTLIFKQKNNLLFELIILVIYLLQFLRHYLFKYREMYLIINRLNNYFKISDYKRLQLGRKLNNLIE